ncbi:MAG: aspartate 1-decarboxylase [Syntrophomonadaceae bacterium]|nr:aspartate 1-decarboxylase [Syntrophomonadaceae bacterium]MDD3888903.1 aspartate 1-decarboxylase [Syntrophomonadaceae bacterium]MDD4548925.1 aspartate 1-decarboxylase [Syntrophomonadaceae bacterium]
MLRYMLKSKIHRAVVTEADLNYVGSITIDRDLMEAADILPNEKVTIVNNNNGQRFETYVIEGKAGSRIICLNGAAARLVQKGDVIIILTYTILEDEECQKHKPRLVYVNQNNEIKKVCQGCYE